MRFIDLFAGLGGFHLALEKLGHECVFSCELDDHLRVVYERNFGLLPAGDIKKVEIEDVPEHDVLCAGFPCQPFSKAGAQEGLACQKQGDLFWNVLDILAYRLPRFFFLENVPNLLNHDGGKTYKLMKNRLVALGYDVREARLSPHDFGIPQVRERAYIVGCLTGLENFEWPPRNKTETSILPLLEDNPPDAKPLSEQALACINVWQEFIAAFPKDKEFPAYPIWAMEFGATYPFENKTPHAMTTRQLSYYKGSLGLELKKVKPAERMLALPSHARTEEDRFPGWKIEFIRKNRILYEENREWIDPWLPKLKRFPSSLQKLEWNAKGEERDIWKYILQFRASGLRVKRTSKSPSLIAMTDTQVPIVAWQSRHMTARECAKLQNLQGLSHLPDTPARSFKALGNAVNSKVIELIATQLLNGDDFPLAEAA